MEVKLLILQINSKNLEEQNIIIMACIVSNMRKQLRDTNNLKKHIFSFGNQLLSQYFRVLQRMNDSIVGNCIK